MKRNILLLTAVVLAAVLMTGCIGPFAKVKVDYVFKVGEADIADNFDSAKLVKKVKKNSSVDFELFFTDKVDAETVTDETYTVMVKEGKKDPVKATLSLIEKEIEKVNTNVGIKFTFPVYKDSLEITVTK